MSKQNLAKEFKKLEIFVDNTDVGVFVAEVNDIRTQAEIIHFLEEKNQVKKVDFDKIKDSFVYELRNSTSNKGITVFYNFIYDKIDYNIVKTLNLSREILKDIGKVIFLLPSYLVWQIQYETPNVRDYVLCFFDFNEKMKMPFEPIFAIDDHVFRTKDERTRLKKLGYQIKNISSIQSIDDFFEYLNTLDYKKITKKVIAVIENTVWSIYSQIKEK